MKQYNISVTQLPEDPRLDKVIPFLQPELSRSFTRSLIENGSVYVNRKRCQKNAKEIRMGDEIRILVAEDERSEADKYVFTADRIIYEDEDLIVVNKPPYLPTHETVDNTRHHLVLALQEFLAAREGESKKGAKGIYLGVHHRLDRDTSGAILFTKRKEANAPVAQAFQNREVQKTYLALVFGVVPQKAVLIQNYLGENPRNRRFFCSVHRGGKYAETLVQGLESFTLQGQKISLVQAEPKTGRTHQIRVHLSEAGHGLLGDQAYGSPRSRNFAGAPRLMLHAWKLAILGKVFEAPLPADFEALLGPKK